MRVIFLNLDVNPALSAARDLPPKVLKRYRRPIDGNFPASWNLLSAKNECTVSILRGDDKRLIWSKRVQGIDLFKHAENLIVEAKRL